MLIYKQLLIIPAKREGLASLIPYRGVSADHNSLAWNAHYIRS
jgi:hypothetical protein